jgi:cytochrome c oxidase assembly protein subunit 15
MIRPLIILFLLGGLQGLVGWIMVKSGLEDSDLVYVSHYKLAIHFILALLVLCYTLWFALQLIIPKEQLFIHRPLRRLTIWLVILTAMQLIYGAFMAGLKAAPAAPTWPDINGTWLPFSFTSFAGKSYNGLSFLTNNPIVIHFIHRNLAYIIFILVCIWWWKASKIKGTKTFQFSKWILPALVFIQLVLGILTLLNVLNKDAFLWLGVAHQFTAMLILLSMCWILYLVRNKLTISPAI